MNIKTLVLFCFSFLSFMQPQIAQNRSAKLEINPYYRYDNFPEISYRVDQRARMDTLKMSGNSYGVNMNYVIPAFKTVIFKFGLGYFRYSFTEISQTTAAYSLRFDGREIKYPNPTAFLFVTDYYWYNTINLNLTIERDIKLSKTVDLQVGIGIVNYFMFSQYYHISAGNKNYNTNKVSYFGLSGVINASILKRFNRVQVGPSFIFPLVDMWKKDALLPEGNEGSFKWKYFNGIGIGLIANYSL